MKLTLGVKILTAAAMAVLLIFISFIVFFQADQKAVIEGKIRQQLTESGSLAANGIAHWLSGRGLLIDVLAETVTQDMTLAQAQAAIERPVYARNFLFSYFGAADGGFAIHPKTNLPDGYDPRKRPWYKDASAAGATTVTDPYRSASTQKIVMTLATPIKQGGKIAGVVGVDIETTTIADIVRTLDLGGIGVAFLVNDEGRILVHPNENLTLKTLAEAFPSDTPSLSARIDTLGEDAGKTMYAFFPIDGLPSSINWSLGFAIDRDLALASVTQFRTTLLIASAVAVAGIVLLLGALIWGLISNPLTTMTRAMSRLAEGDHSVSVPALHRRDEIGAMAAAVEVFKRHAIENERLTTERAEAERRSADQRMTDERRRALNALADTFEQKVLSIVNQVVEGCGATRDVAQKLTDSATESSTRSESMRAAASATDASVEGVASATVALSAAIAEIGAQIQETNRLSHQAVNGVESTTAVVENLSEAAHRISEVVGLIQNVAGQTNLLALNATIEAARAGEAGKGFAVVAGEVKTLANQTDKATLDIQSQVEDIQQTSTRSVKEIGQIRDVITQMNSFADAIAQAVDKQGEATSEIRASMQQAAQETRSVAEDVSAMTDAADMVHTLSERLLQASGAMQQTADSLRREVGVFITTMRAG